MSGVSRQVGSIGIKLLPLPVAALAVWLQPNVTQLSRSHETVLPLVTLIVLAAMLHPRLRQFFVVTLCYGVAFFAIKDTERVNKIPLPASFRYDFMYTVRPCTLWAVALLALLAGAGETLQTGAVWVRRCYFGAVALYFTGLGIIDYAWHTSWRSVVLIVTGGAACLGCIFAHFLVGVNADENEGVEYSDETVQQALDTAHKTALQAKEWRDTLVG